jgi:PKD repeat protein
MRTSTRIFRVLLQVVIAVLVFIRTVNAQDTRSISPLQTSGSGWKHVGWILDSTNFPYMEDMYNLTFNGDTVISSKIYYKYYYSLIHFYQGQNPDTLLKHVYAGCLRSDGEKVFYIGKNNNSELLLYDYSLKIGDTLPNGVNPANSKFIITDTITIQMEDGSHRLKYTILNTSNYTPGFILYGIGYNTGLLNPASFEVQTYNGGVDFQTYCEYGNRIYKEAGVTFIPAQNCDFVLDSINVLHLYGTVTDSVTHIPVPNHPVIIDNDTMNGTTYPHHKIVYTDAAGVYNDTVFLPSNLTTWRYIVRTYDGNSNQYYFASGYGSGDNHHDFSIYTSEYSGCHAYFVAYPDSSSAFSYHFLDQSFSNIGSWYWDFGDGSNSTQKNPSHIYATGFRSYHVCLIVVSSDSTCSDVYCYDVLPGAVGCQAIFACYPDSTHSNTLKFVDHSVWGVVQWHWDFGDPASGINNISSLRNPSHTYPGSGPYPVCLTIWTSPAYACSVTNCREVYVPNAVAYHQLYGQVFAGSFPLQEGLASIFSIDTSQTYVPYTEASTIDSNGVYFFTLVPDGNYMIFAIPDSSETYLPTYYGDAIEWEEATLITLGTPVNPYDIHLVLAAAMTPGPGSASGHINAGKLPGSMIDKITMTLQDANHHAISFSRVNSGGEFHFPTLDYGTYYLHPEMAGITSDLVRIEITASKPHVDVVMTFTGNHINGTGDLNEGEEILIYPNPVTDKLLMSFGFQSSSEMQIQVCKITGEVISTITRHADPGRTVISIPFADYSYGFYLLRIRTDSGINISKKVVKTK